MSEFQPVHHKRRRQIIAGLCSALLLCSHISFGFQMPPLIVAMHSFLLNEASALSLIPTIPKLSKLGVNTLFLEVNYNFDYKTHPELVHSAPVTLKTARRIALAARLNGIRLIPCFNIVGHQSWSTTTMALLRVYPEFDETPGQYPNNEGIYCRSWCVQNPDIYPIITDLMGELIHAFQADGFHIGMDEVFLIGSEHCPRCQGKPPSVLFAKAVKDYHHYLVEERGLEMFMWGDRLINANDPNTNYGMYEASANYTWAAIDMIPKDIVICDWHYEVQDSYNSIPYFLNRGFKILPASFKELDSTEKLIQYSLKYHWWPNMRGHVFTHWGATGNEKLHQWDALVEMIHLLR